MISARQLGFAFYPSALTVVPHWSRIGIPIAAVTALYPLLPLLATVFTGRIAISLRDALNARLVQSAAASVSSYDARLQWIHYVKVCTD